MIPPPLTLQQTSLGVHMNGNYYCLEKLQPENCPTNFSTTICEKMKDKNSEKNSFYQTLTHTKKIQQRNALPNNARPKLHHKRKL